MNDGKKECVRKMRQSGDMGKQTQSLTALLSHQIPPYNIYIFTLCVLLSETSSQEERKKER